MQWKETGWPILVDSYNLLDARYAPITLAIDECGVIRQIQPPLDADRLEATFLAKSYEPPAGLPTESETAGPLLASLTAPARSANA